MGAILTKPLPRFTRRRHYRRLRQGPRRWSVYATSPNRVPGISSTPPNQRSDTLLPRREFTTWGVEPTGQYLCNYSPLASR